MAAATIGNSKPTIFQSTSINRVPKNHSNITSLPDASILAEAVSNTENPIYVVFKKLSNKYSLPVSDFPTSLSESFRVLENISKVLSSLPVSEKSNVKLELKKALNTFYLQNMNLSESVSAKAANRMANALTNGPNALAKLERVVNNHPQAVEFAENVLANLKSQDSVKPSLAKQPRHSSGRAKDSVNPTLAKQSRDPDRIKAHILHTPV